MRRKIEGSIRPQLHQEDTIIRAETYTIVLTREKIDAATQNVEAESCNRILGKYGRGGEIRTHDPLYPKQVRYQTAPRPEPCGASTPARRI